MAEVSELSFTDLREDLRLFLVDKLRRHEIVGLTYSQREPVFINSPPIRLRPLQPLEIRERRAKEITTRHTTDGFYSIYEYRREFKPVNSKFNNIHFDGLVLQKTDNPTSWKDYNVFTSTASHHEIYKVATHNQNMVQPDSICPIFNIEYVRDPTSNVPLLIAEIRYSSKPYVSPNDNELEAILRFTKPAYYYCTGKNRGPLNPNPFT